MKKKKAVLFILPVLCIGLMLFGCTNPSSSIGGGGSSIKKSTLTVRGSPAGYSFTTLVYSSSVRPYTYSDYNSMTTSAIASGRGDSSIELIWPKEKKSGNHLVVVWSGSTRKFDVVNFNNGDATVDWNTMTDTSSLP